jgi:hypothetical protein
VIILEILGEIFVELIFRGIILGIFRLFKKSVEFIRVNVFGFKAKPIKQEKILEKKLLYKNIELIENLNSELQTGQNGVILEVINRNKVFAEFYGKNGEKIEFNNELVFEIGIKQFKLEK